MKSRKIHPRIWKFTGTDDVNVYLLDAKRKILIDCGNRTDQKELEKEVKKITEPSKIELILFTHLHYDHTGNAALFKNARFLASAEEINDFKKCAPFYPDKNLLTDIQPFKANKDILEKEDLEIIGTPGHTKGSVCIWWKQEKTLFTGDTYFREGLYGRIDLANSEPEKMGESIAKTVNIPAKLICPGHDY